MPTLISRHFSGVCLLLVAMAAQSQDLHVKKNITVDGNAVSSTETWFQGSRERIVSQSPTGATTTLKQCDLKRTVTLGEEAQAYFVSADPKDEVVTSAPAAASGAYILETSVVTDTGESKLSFGLSAHHLKTTVTVQSSKDACTQVNQKYEVDGWYVDVSKEQAACQAFLPPVRQASACSDRIVRRRTGNGKLGFPLREAITLRNDDGTTTAVEVKSTSVLKKPLEKELFEVPSGYREVKTLAELNGAGKANPGTQPAGGSQGSGSAGLSKTSAPGAVAQPGGKIRIGIAPPDAQVGQGTNKGGDYSTPIRNAEVALMSGPAIDIIPLDSHIAVQLQAEAQQKQCKYIMFSSVTVKHAQAGGFGKFAKYGSMAANATPMGMMAHTMAAATAAQAATMAASEMARQQAINQLSNFNGQIKSKDDVTVAYQLTATGQPTPVVQNSLQGKAKSDGEDVLTPLLQQAATNVLTEASKK